MSHLACLRIETDHTTDGYKPYVNENGFVHMANLLRDDINRGLAEQYQLKVRDSSISLCFNSNAHCHLASFCLRRAETESGPFSQNVNRKTCERKLAIMAPCFNAGPSPEIGHSQETSGRAPRQGVEPFVSITIH